MSKFIDMSISVPRPVCANEHTSTNIKTLSMLGMNKTKSILIGRPYLKKELEAEIKKHQKSLENEFLDEDDVHEAWGMINGLKYALKLLD